MDKIALISGANRGIGLETGKQLLELGWNVVFTARNMHEGRPLINKLREKWKSAWFHQLDVTDEQSISDVAEYVEDTCGRLDVLINNAGIMIEENHKIMNVELDDMHKTMATNLYGPLMLTRTMLPFFKDSKDARVINVSSRMGQLSGMEGGHAAYRISKAALNALTIVMAKELEDDGIRVNTICPGWVRTDMGGPDANKSIEKGADTAVWLATADKIENGKFYADRKVIPW
ncbi:MAG: SDR family oxidoreductase [Bacteroidales bacterium]|nr:SDR family oxidoreductase [Bacteroidales bacterium]